MKVKNISANKSQISLNKTFKIAAIGKVLILGFLLTSTVLKGIKNNEKDTVIINAYDSLKKDKTITPKELEIYKQMVKAKKITWEEAKKINDSIKDSLNIVKQIARESKFK